MLSCLGLQYLSQSREWVRLSVLIWFIKGDGSVDVRIHLDIRKKSKCLSAGELNPSAFFPFELIFRHTFTMPTTRHLCHVYVGWVYAFTCEGKQKWGGNLKKVCLK